MERFLRRRNAIAVAAVALVAVGIFLHGQAGSTHLRATVGRCTPAQRRLHAAACAQIEAAPAILIAGPLIGKNGTPAHDVIARAGSRRRVDVHLRAGTYLVFLVIDHRGTIRTDLGQGSLVVPEGGVDVDRLSPGDPWEFTGVPGA